MSCAVALALLGTVSCNMSAVIGSDGQGGKSGALEGWSSLEDGVIAFSMAADTATKALDVTTANMTTFEVTAFTHGTTANPYFNAEAYTGGSGTFNSATPHYWPSSGALDFYAWSVGSATGQVVKNSYKSFTVTPDSDPSRQVDLVFACSDNSTKAGASGGAIPLAFAKTMSRVSVKVKNTSSDYKFQVTGWKVGYVATTGTFTYSGSGTSIGSQLSSSMWSGNTTRSADRSYSSTFSTVNVAASASTPVTLPGEMILVPQSGAAATGYASASTGAAINGSYVAIRMVIKKASDDSVVQAETWAVWPTEVSWEPGKGYVYTVDLAGGGYFETNQEGTDAEMDPVIAAKVEPTITVSVDDCYVGDPVIVTVTTNASGTYTFEVDGIRLAAVGGPDSPAVCNFSAMAFGNKTVTVSFPGNESYLAKSVSASFTVSKKSSAIKGGDRSASYPKDVILTITVPEGATGYIEIVSFKILNTSTSEYEDFYDYSIPARGSSGDGTIVNGKAKIFIQGLPNTDASYKISIYYSGDDKYNPSDVISISISYKKKNVIESFTT